MDDQADLTTKKPVHILFRELKLDPRKTFTALAKAAVSGIKQDYFGVATNLGDAITGLSLKDKAEYAAWALIYNALTRSVALLVEDYHDLFDSEYSESTLESVTYRLDEELQGIEIDLDLNFFDQPDKLEFFIYLKDPLCFWLTGLGLKEHEARAFFYRLKNHFVISLHKCWLDKSADFQCIENALKTPFVQAQKKQREWMQYNAWLKDQVKQRMFAEAFSLEQIYVKLRAFYLRDSVTNENGIKTVNLDIEANLEATQARSEKVVVDIHEELLQWVDNFDADDSIRVVSGGPGSGKSSFAKMFAAQVVSEVVDVPVLFVPLHHFAIEDDLTSAVEKFIRDDLYLSGNPLDANHGQDRLLLIFDGLDELSIHGKASAEASEYFVSEVITKLDRFNGQGLKRQALITGRDLSIQTNAYRLRGKKQIFHLLPYFVDEDSLKNYIDEKELLSEDQRNLWWENYGIAGNKPVNSMPNALRLEHLTPITSEPLLNYLVALSYERKRINFGGETTLNEIYSDLLRSVYERQWEGGSKGRLHTSIETLEYEKFERVLEEIALTVWHGNGRTATEKDIYDKLNSSSFNKYLKVFQESAEKGVSRLLTAFYFRQSDNNTSENKTFEFTHKSFGEYLIAKRLFRSIGHLHHNLTMNEQDPEYGYNEIEALKRWAEITGPTEMDWHILNFLRVEVHNEPLEVLTAWQETFGSLLGLAARKGMPMHELGIRDFRLMQIWSRNSEEMLLAVHSACALKTKKIIHINWGNYFTDWLRRILGDNITSAYIAIGCLQYLDFQAANLHFYNFRDADLRGSNLKNANLFGATFYFSILIGVELSNADLRRVNLTLADLTEANIVGADLRGAYLCDDYQDCNARDNRLGLFRRRSACAILNKTILDKSNLEGAFLRGVVFENTNLFGTNLKHTRLISENVLTDQFDEMTIFPDGVDRKKCIEAYMNYIRQSHEMEAYPELNTNHEDE